MNKLEQGRMKHALEKTFPENPDIITLWNSTKKLLKLAKAIDRKEFVIASSDGSKSSWNFTRNRWETQ